MGALGDFENSHTVGEVSNSSPVRGVGGRFFPWDVLVLVEVRAAGVAVRLMGRIMRVGGIVIPIPLLCVAGATVPLVLFIRVTVFRILARTTIVRKIFL